jgi:hypothetical protein
LVVVAGAIGGLLLTVVVLVIILACRRAARHPPDLSAWPRSQQDRLSTSTTNTTSSNQEPDDLDGSDSLPEYHANYVKQSVGSSSSLQPQQQPQSSQPDLLHSNIIYGASVNTYTGKIYGGGSMMDDYANYHPPSNSSGHHQHGGSVSNSRLGGYSHSGSENNLLEVAGNSSNNRMLYSSPNYSSPYLQSASPISQLSSSHQQQQLHISTSSPLGHRHHRQQGWGELGGYTGGPAAYTSGRFNAVAHSLQSTEVDLNESSVGTHV